MWKCALPWLARKMKYCLLFSDPCFFLSGSKYFPIWPFFLCIQFLYAHTVLLTVKNATSGVRFWTTVRAAQAAGGHGVPCPPPTQHRKNFQNKTQRRSGKNQDLRISKALLEIFKFESWPSVIRQIWGFCRHRCPGKNEGVYGLSHDHTVMLNVNKFLCGRKG